MKLSISIVIAIHLVALTFAFDVETERLIDDFVENFMRNHQIPGLGLSVVRNGTVLMSKGYGMRNISAGLASDENTLFPIGSITKTFVAVLVVKTLNELYPQRGVAVLDIPIAQLIPPTVNFTLSDRYRAEQTTFRDILAHRHCLHTGEVDAMFGSVPSAAEYAFRARYLPEICEFRNGFSYNNNMMSLAGEYIAAIAGTTLQNMVENLCCGVVKIKQPRFKQHTHATENSGRDDFLRHAKMRQIGTYEYFDKKRGAKILNIDSKLRFFLYFLNLLRTESSLMLLRCTTHLHKS